MKRIIEELIRKISLETKPNMTLEQEYYVSGLSDALEIVRKYNSQYLVGNIYYVIVFDKQGNANIKRMKLYRINQKTKTSYCFSYNLEEGKLPHCDLILYNINSLRIRVHKTLEEAEKHKSIAIVSRLEYKKKTEVLLMLVPAISRKAELEELFAIHLYDDNMFFYDGYLHCNTIVDLTPKENTYRWAIINKENRVIGYFAYFIDTLSDNVCGFGLYSFECNPIIGFDVNKKMKELIASHRRIEWRMIEGNPVQKHYDKFCKRYNGNKVILNNVVKGSDGKYHNEHIYEIFKGEII